MEEQSFIFGGDFHTDLACTVVEIFGRFGFIGTLFKNRSKKRRPAYREKPAPIRVEIRFLNGFL